MSSEFSLIANTSNTEGVAQTISRLRSEFGVKIGSSTGYTSEIMAKLKVSTAQSARPLSYLLSSPWRLPRDTARTAT